MIVGLEDSVTFFDTSDVEFPCDHDNGLLGLYEAELLVMKVIITIENGKK